MSNTETNSRDVARLLERTAARTFKMQADEIVSAFDEAETLCLSMVSSEKEKVEVKRRVAEWKMRLLCDRDAAFRIVELLHNNVVELGYTNLEIEGSTEIYFAQYCERQGQADDARRTLHQLRTKLDSALRRKDLEVYRHFKEVSDDILSRIDTGSK
ncbi:MAG: hypothetical protein Tsb0027_25570 [Wenzhouxiangellaceae bacterium]